MDRIKASLILHALGDTIGYKNGEWEFNYGNTAITEMYTFELVSRFIALGGITCIDLKGWRVSDDTVVHLDTIKALVESENTDDFLKKFRKNLIDSFDDIKTRHPGNTMYNKIKYMKKHDSDALFTFDKDSGGAGAAMRAPIFGILYSDPKDRDELMEKCILSSVITHNHPTGYLGALSTALFVSYALNNTPIEEWGKKMIEFIESDKLEQFMKKKVSYYYNIHKKYKFSFIGKWKAYLKDKFDKDNKIIMRIGNLAKRNRYYLDNYASDAQFIGSSGDDCLILVYDALLDAYDSFEQIIYYTMLHIGDTDTTGCIAGAIFGALYGFRNLPANLIKNIEYKDRIEKLYEDIVKIKENR